MNRTGAFFRLAPHIRKILGISAAGIIALYAGFVYFPPKECERLVRACGYWWMFALAAGFAVAVVFAVRDSGGWRKVGACLWPGRTHALLIVAVSIWLLHIDGYAYKILFDEPVQASTAFTLHTERELATTTRAFRVNGMFTVLSTYLDKRPPMFPFLVAIVHDLFGFRAENAFVVNSVGTVLLVMLVWYLGRRYGQSPAAGACAIGLLATFLELGVTATGAGMDLVNLTMLAALWVAAIWYVERPSDARAALLVATAAVLAYCRYESALYVGVAILAWAVVAWRKRAWLLANGWALLPLALVLYAWHSTVLSNTPALWELRPEQSQRFSLGYAPNNLDHAWRFLLAVGWSLPNSALIVATGVLGGTVVAIRAAQRQSALRFPEGAALAIVATCILLSFATLMCYYWGELDDPLVSRLSLPLHLLLVIAAIAGWRELAAWVPRRAMSWRWPAAAISLVLLTITLPAAARDRFTAGNLMRKNFDWERTVAARFWPAPDLVITNRSPICWLADGICSISIDRARLRLEQLQWHLQHHSFSNVLIMQRVLTRGASGGWVVDPTDMLPERFHLEEVAVRRFGLTLTRVSRLVEIEPEPSRETAQ